MENDFYNNVILYLYLSSVKGINFRNVDISHTMIIDNIDKDNTIVFVTTDILGNGLAVEVKYDKLLEFSRKTKILFKAFSGDVKAEQIIIDAGISKEVLDRDRSSTIDDYRKALLMGDYVYQS